MYEQRCYICFLGIGGNVGDMLHNGYCRTLGREGQGMSYEEFIELLDFTLDTRRKRHIIGGVLLSISLLFGGLAVTAITLDREDNHE